MKYGIYKPLDPEPVEVHDDEITAHERARALQQNGDVRGPVHVRPVETGASGRRLGCSPLAQAAAAAVVFVLVGLAI